MPDSITQVFLTQFHPILDDTIGALTILVNFQVNNTPTILRVDPDIRVFVHGECIGLAVFIEV